MDAVEWSGRGRLLYEKRFANLIAPQIGFRGMEAREQIHHFAILKYAHKRHQRLRCQHFERRFVEHAISPELVRMLGVK